MADKLLKILNNQSAAGQKWATQTVTQSTRSERAKRIWLKKCHIVILAICLTYFSRVTSSAFGAAKHIFHCAHESDEVF